jgi:hypothetical protein
MANDPRVDDVAGLPVKSSDPPPDYLVMAPTSIIDDAMAAGPGAASHKHHKYGAEFDFYMGTVLQHMVPGTVRAAFEAEVASHPAGTLTPDAAAALSQRFPRVASAYAPEQWQRTFGSRGLDAAAHGAVWVKPGG